MSGLPDALLSPTPLVCAVTPARAEVEESPHLPACGQNIRVVLRIKPPELDPYAGPPCIVDLGGNSLSIAAPPKEGEGSEAAADMSGTTPSRATTPGRARPSGTPGRAGASAPGRDGGTPGARRPTAPGSRAEGGDRTPGRARTPSGRRPTAPGGRAEGGEKSGPAATRRFTYDKVASPEETQASIFAEARPLVLSALAGGNACVLAYGQTGSGKTHTMVGEAGAPGVIPRAFDLMWDKMDASPATEWHVAITCVGPFTLQTPPSRHRLPFAANALSPPIHRLRTNSRPSTQRQSRSPSGRHAHLTLANTP